MLHTSDLVGRYGYTSHGERIRVVGSANDPARCSVVPVDEDGSVHPEAEWFTPRVATLVLDEAEDTSADVSSEHGHDVCPDCGDTGTAIDARGYFECSRFLGCWSDGGRLD